MQVRFVKIQFGNGRVVVAALEGLTDEEIAAFPPGMEITFSNSFALPNHAPLGKVLTAAARGFTSEVPQA